MHTAVCFNFTFRHFSFSAFQHFPLPMRLYEHEGKAFFKQFKIPASEGKVVTNPDDAVDIAAQLGYPVVLKAQVLTGGRRSVET